MTKATFVRRIDADTILWKLNKPLKVWIGFRRYPLTDHVVTRVFTPFLQTFEDNYPATRVLPATTDGAHMYGLVLGSPVAIGCNHHEALRLAGIKIGGGE